MSTETLTRPPRTYTSFTRTARKISRQPEQILEDGDRIQLRSRRKLRGAKKDPPPLIQKFGLAAQVASIQGLMGTIVWLQGWREWLYPPGGGPNIVKAYEVRPNVGVRIFFPSSFDLTSPQTLPTVLTIHGGGFCIGTARDDDEWNRAFADSQNMLVISLPYAKAPRMPFPYALHDLEVLYTAVLGDESLPISRGSKGGNEGQGKGRVAVLGFDAGGNLALGLSQLPRIRQHATPPTAVVSISGYLDVERPVAQKLRNRPFKPSLPAPNNAPADALAATYEAYLWSYVPYGTDLQDPLLSPAFARWGDEGGGGGGGEGGLPAHVCLVGAELDVLAHESWRMACRLVRDGGVNRVDGRYGRWRVPDPDADDALQSVCGAEQAAKAHWQEQLELSELPPAAAAAAAAAAEEEEGGGGRQAGGAGGEDGLDSKKRFGFEVCWQATDEDEAGSVKWILVPDVLHGFDRTPWRAGAGSPEVVKEAEAKTRAYVDSIGGWLRDTVWKT